jgi:L-asparaginase
MKKILIIHTGGTFGMTPAKPKQVLAPGNLQSQILHSVPEIADLADIDVEIPFNMDSSNLGADEWDQLSDIIFSRMNDYDGFVIVHGTDTMVFTAAALSFSLINLCKPVVLTGSQRPLSMLRSDARSNLVDSVELATMAIPEVLIIFGQQILRGNRAKKISISSYHAFESPNYPALGEIGLKIKLDYSRILSSHGAPSLLKGYNTDIAVISIAPALKPEFYRGLLQSQARVLLIMGFGAGNLPNSNPDWILFIRDAAKAGKTVFIGSQSSEGNVDLDLYECGQLAKEAGAQGLADITFEAAYVKLQKILMLTVIPSEIIAKFYQNWAGEINS